MAQRFSSAERASQAQPSRQPSQKDLADLAETLRRATRSRPQAERVLELLAEALDIAGLPLDDPRLHLRFDPRARALHVTINQRYVAWAFAKVRSGRRSGFGLILDDPEVAWRVARDARLGARVGWFRRPDTPALDLPTEHLGELPRAVRDSWHRAIRLEVARTTKDGKRRTSSYLKHKRPALYSILRDPGLCQTAASMAFEGAEEPLS